MKKRSLTVLITLAMVAVFVAAMTVTACAADTGALGNIGNMFTKFTGMIKTLPGSLDGLAKLPSLFNNLTEALKSLMSIVNKIMEILGGFKF